jgi:hypothetical protein
LTRQKERLAASGADRDRLKMAEPVISREEVVGLLFTVNDISWALRDIRSALVEEDDGKEDENDQG